MSATIQLPPVAVGSKEAARLLGIGIDRLADLRTAGVIATVPHLSTPKKLVYAVRELERVAELGVQRKSLRVAS